MATKMVRKQIYIQKRQDELLKRIAEARGISQAEVIRLAIEREISGTTETRHLTIFSGWNNLIEFVEQRRRTTSSEQAYRWNREDINSSR